MDQVDMFSNLASRPVTPTRTRVPAFGTGRPTTEVSPVAGKTVTLAEWEAAAPLNDQQSSSVAFLRNACGSRPYPARFAGEAESGPSNLDAEHSRGTTLKKPAQNLLQAALHSSTLPSQPPSRTASPALGQITMPSTLGGDIANPVLVATPQQFHEHFSHLTSSLSHSQDAMYRAHLAEISGYREACEELEKELDDVEGLVESMIGCLRWVEDRGESLRIAGEGLMHEESDLNLQTQHIASRLSYFTSLEQAQRMLNNPGEDLVLSEGFLGMVQRVDECLTYLRSHTDFRDAEIYIIRYQQCMTRSMTLIKMYVVNALRSLGMEVAKRVNDKQMNRSETATIALLYTKFTSLAFPLRPLLAELELRASENPAELGSLQEECHSAWISVRKGLINPRVEREVKAMEPASLGTSVVELTRTGCGYLKMTCLDEYNLWRQFFNSGEAVLYKYLEGLCDHLFDHLRPRILHEQSLMTLCEICTVLQGLMVEQLELDEDETPGGGEIYHQDPDSYFPTVSSSNSQVLPGPHTSYDQEQSPQTRLHVTQLLKMVMQDAQTRLVARSQALIRTDVEYYSAKGDDLDYPQKIEGTAAKLRSDSGVLAVSLDEEDDEDPAFFELPSKATQETWYPTLRSTLWVLSCLHTYVETDVFEDIAHEAIASCRKSLLAASRILATKTKTSRLDGQLFLVRHLLILKEMTASVDLVRRYRGVTASRGVVDTLSALLANALRMVGVGALLGLGSYNASSMQHNVDAKADVDRELKSVCEDMIAECADRAMIPIQPFLNHFSSFVAARQPATDLPAAKLAAQPWAGSNAVVEMHERLRVELEHACTSWIRALKLYLQDDATVRVLIPPLQNDIMDRYRPFYDIVRSEYDAGISSIIMSPQTLLALLQRIEGEQIKS